MQSAASDLSQQFQQAAEHVSNLPAEQAGPEMHTLYGLYKQATDGDHDTFRGEVGREDHDNPDGPAGLSQAQWDSWSQFKGLSQEEAMRRYVQEVGKLRGAGSHGKGDGVVDDEPNYSQAQPTHETPTNVPAAGPDVANTTLAGAYQELDEPASQPPPNPATRSGAPDVANTTLAGVGPEAPDPIPTGTEAAAANAGLRGDLRAGAPYGSEEERKEDDDAQRGFAAPNNGITES